MLRLDSECKRWNQEPVAFTVFFVWVTVCCAMVQAKCLHLIVSLFLNSLTMGTAAEVVASDILVGARPGLVRDPRAANWSTQPQHHGSSEWKTPRMWDCSSHSAKNDEAEEHPASP